jgi:hypothetical protein
MWLRLFTRPLLREPWLQIHLRVFFLAPIDHLEAAGRPVEVFVL